MTKNAASDQMGTLYAERTSQRENMRHRRAELQKEIGLASAIQINKRQLAEDAAHEVSRFMKSVREENERLRRNKDFMEPWQKERRDKLNIAAHTAGEDAARAEHHKKEISEEIDRLDNELENFGCLIDATDVLEYQKDVTTAEEKVCELHKLITGQKDIIEQARPAETNGLDDLLKDRENLLAAIAMGKATDSDLVRLEEQIEARQTASDTFNQISARAMSVIAGLQRKLDEAETALNSLRSKREDIITEYFMGQAEVLGEQYVKLSLKLVEKYKELMALDEIIGYPSRLTGPVRDGFAIPTFKLRAFDGLEKKGIYGQIGAVCAVSGLHRERSVIQAAVDQLKAKFSAEGINL